MKRLLGSLIRMILLESIIQMTEFVNRVGTALLRYKTIQTRGHYGK